MSMNRNNDIFSQSSIPNKNDVHTNIYQLLGKFKDLSYRCEMQIDYVHCEMGTFEDFSKGIDTLIKKGKHGSLKYYLLELVNETESWAKSLLKDATGEMTMPTVIACQKGVLSSSEKAKRIFEKKINGSHRNRNRNISIDELKQTNDIYQIQGILKDLRDKKAWEKDFITGEQHGYNKMCDWIEGILEVGKGHVNTKQVKQSLLLDAGDVIDNSTDYIKEYPSSHTNKLGVAFHKGVIKSLQKAKQLVRKELKPRRR